MNSIRDAIKKALGEPCSMVEMLRKGDVDGHEFHGNQYGGGGGGNEDNLKPTSAYSLLRIKETRDALSAKGISHSHISEKRPLIEQRKMLQELAAQHKVSAVYFNPPK